MEVIFIQGHGGPEHLRLVDRELPASRPGQVRVDVRVPPASTARTCCSGRACTRRRQAWWPTCRGSSMPVSWPNAVPALRLADASATLPTPGSAATLLDLPVGKRYPALALPGIHEAGGPPGPTAALSADRRGRTRIGPKA